MAELVDALDSKSSSARSAGSIPARGTTHLRNRELGWRYPRSPPPGITAIEAAAGPSDSLSGSEVAYIGPGTILVGCSGIGNA